MVVRDGEGYGLWQSGTAVIGVICFLWAFWWSALLLIEWVILLGDCVRTSWRLCENWLRTV